MSSCYSKKGFNGTWIGQYSNDTIFKDVITSPQIISFKNGTYQSEDIYGNIGNGEFDLFFNEITLDNKKNDYGLISHINSDSIVFESKNQKGKHLIYKKLSDSLKSDSTDKVIFKGNKFSLKFNNKIDTLNFVNDSLLTRTYSDSRAIWKRIKMNGFDIILIDGFNEPPLIIREKIDNKLKIFLFHKSALKMELEEIK